jgi:phosphatidate cytidylyltransferase
VAPVATIGDLIESSLKRNLGIKDMSNILPGHGGLMDRLDSLVLVVPLAWFVLRLIAPY